nr:S-layer homology domain-containing protein [uncultured Oscillibacter sp.]
MCNPPATDKPTHPGSDDISVSGYVDLGTLEKNASTSSRTGSFTVRNTSGFDMSFSVGTASGYKISAPSSISAGSSATVTVELNSSNGVGTYNRSLDMSVSFKDGDGQSYSFSTKLYAEVVEKGYALAADPASKDLGKLKEGYSEKEAKEKEVTVSIQNKGASSVRMDGVKGNDHFTVTAVGDDYETLKNGEKASYKIVPKQGLAVGTYTDTITFLTRENTNATFKATVVIEKKLDPLTVEPNPLDFGVAEEGYAALTQKTVTVKNNTDYAIRLNQPTSYSYEISLLSQTSLPAGSSATFTIRPRTGLPANLYDGVVEVYGSSNDNTLAAKLNVKFSVNRPAGPSTFSDVAAGSTFAADIAYVSQKGLMSGKGGGLFKPQESITRGQLVTILYRLEGQPAVSGAGFPDVAAGSYCEKAVKWAAANGITAGGKDGLFRPNDSITREQLATFLYRYNNYKGYVVSKQADLSAFSDSGSVSSYAKDALSWANGTGLVNGTSDGRLNPSGGATRGQAAAILHRFCVSIGR